MTLTEVQNKVGYHMDKIAKFFKPGAKVTVAVRHPGYPERDFLMTNDTIPEVQALLARRAHANCANQNDVA